MKDRVIYLDYLRVFAAFAVILLHAGTQKWYDLDVGSFYWNVYNFYVCICQWCVPVFLMISGALFLGSKDYSIKDLFCKKIFRLVTAFVFWSAIYALLYDHDSVEQCVRAFIRGYYHMWFVVMIIQIYIIIPIIRQIMSDERVKTYFVYLSVITLLGADIFNMANTFGNEAVRKAVSALSQSINFDILFSVKHVTYFVLGYYLATTEVTHKKLICAAALVSVACTIAIGSLHSVAINKPFGYFGNFSIYVFFASIFIFTLFKDKVRNCFLDNTIITLSRYSFGIYLVHALVLRQLPYIGIHSLLFNPILCVPFMAVLAFIISALITHLIFQVPVLRKYIV